MAIAAVEPGTHPHAEPERDLWFNPHLGPSGIPAHQVIGVPVLAVKTYKRKRALKGKDLDTLYRVLIALTANLIHHYLIGSPGQGIPVPLSNKSLGRKGNRYQPFSFPRSFPKMLYALRDLGFARVTIGTYSGLRSQSKRTTVRAGPKLVALIREHKVTFEDLSAGDADEVIVLKRSKRGFADEGARIDYVDNATTSRFRSELRSINTWLAQADIRFDPRCFDQPVNVGARRLYRSFTLGRFDRGGRLFGGFWETLPKAARLNGLRIDGEPVLGLDYSQLNPLLAYSKAKANPPSGDAYTLPGLEHCREGVKKVFNAMLFSHVKKFPKKTRALFPRSVKCEAVTTAILKQHPKLKEVLSEVGIGHQLQFTESEIMMRVLHACQNRSITALPVFDCVVVRASAEAAVTEIMKREFRTVTGLSVTVKRELPDQQLTNSTEEMDPSTRL